MEIKKGCGKKVWGGCPNLRICGENNYLCNECKEKLEMQEKISNFEKTGQENFGSKVYK